MAMPFFHIDENSSRLRMSSDIWIYVTLAVPLTGVTVLYWRWRVRNIRVLHDRSKSLEAGEV